MRFYKLGDFLKYVCNSLLISSLTEWNQGARKDQRNLCSSSGVSVSRSQIHLPGIGAAFFFFLVFFLFVLGASFLNLLVLVCFLCIYSSKVLAMNVQDWSPLGWTGWIFLQSKGPQESSPAPQFKSINSWALSFLYSPTLTSICDYWKNHSFD